MELVPVGCQGRVVCEKKDWVQVVLVLLGFDRAHLFRLVVVTSILVCLFLAIKIESRHLMQAYHMFVLVYYHVEGNAFGV